MDEYLRNRYKKAGSGEPARPARPMFPVTPRPHQPAPQPQPRPAPVQHHQPAPASHHAAPVQHHTAAEHRARPKRRFGFLKILAVLLILGSSAGGGYYYLAYVKDPTPIPQQLVKAAGFPVYYPTKLPSSYKYQPGSANNQKGLFIYKIADGSNGVIVSQQARSSRNVDPSIIPDFKPITVGDGSAVIGTSSGVTTVIYLTPTTLINMTALNAISRGDMISIAQNLSTIKRKTGLLQVLNIDFIRSGVLMERAVYKDQ